MDSVKKMPVHSPTEVVDVAALQPCPTTGSASAGLVDHTISVLNAWIGDFLVKSDNDLQQQMAFYRNNRPVEPGALPLKSDSKVCVLVHGLGCNEAQWRFEHDGIETDYAAQLQGRLGFVPLYLRYNTGRRISENGALLAKLLDQLWEHSEGPPQQLVLIGHSMGGLVIRSACHQASAPELKWLTSLSHAIYLGSPHLGAPLEKAANIASNLLGMFDTTATQVIRDVLHSRSEGIKDLRYGNLVEEDWLEYDPDELLQNRRVPVPWLEGVSHCRVVGAIGSSAEHPVSRIFGDAMVSTLSAKGYDQARCEAGLTATDPGHLCVLPGLSHLELARNPEVSRQVESWISKA